MAYNFLPCDRNQAYLLPPSLKDWPPEGHLAWFVLDVVEQTDLSEFYKKYRTDGVGNSAFHPSMMVALLIYSYCTGERSSRKIEKHCQTDVAYKVVTANQCPGHSTISRFRKDNQSRLKKLFLEILRLCAEAGLVKLGNVSLDGTKKIKANASLSANRTLKHLEQEIDKMFSEAEAKDAEEDEAYGADKRGDEMPDDLRGRNSRINRLKACKARLEREKAEAEKQQQNKINQRNAKEESTGKKPRGRKPKLPEEAGNKDAGCCSGDNFTKKPAGDVELLVATQKDYKQRKAIAGQPEAEEPIPDNLSPQN